MKRLSPCKRCGSIEITLWDCGYSSFNKGGGRCSKGHEVSGDVGCLPSKRELANVWNNAQLPTEVEKWQEIARQLQEDNARLRKVEAAADKLANIVLEQTSGYSCGPGKVAADAAREVKALAGEEKP